MPEPINITIPLDIHIHRHNGLDTDDAEVRMGDGPTEIIRARDLVDHLRNRTREADIRATVAARTGLDITAEVAPHA